MSTSHGGEVQSLGAAPKSSYYKFYSYPVLELDNTDRSQPRIKDDCSRIATR
jgi:hypothetical protein